MSNIRDAAIALYDRFTHEGMDRRLFMAELTRLAGSAAAANALLVSIAANPAAAAIIPEGDKRLQTRTLEWDVRPGRKMKGYGAAPVAAASNLPLVIVVHENRGLNEHTRDVARRVALAGFSAVAPDFLTPGPGTPADENQAREMIGKLDLGETVADGVAMIDWLSSPAGGSRKVGVVGFCWGGALVHRLAVAAGPNLKAAVSYYGPAPVPAEAAKVQAPLLIHGAGRDQRVNTSLKPWVEALTAAGKDVQWVLHNDVDHAFNNDTSVERYNKQAADRAWAQTTAFFDRHLG